MAAEVLIVVVVVKRSTGFNYLLILNILCEFYQF